MRQPTWCGAVLLFVSVATWPSRSAADAPSALARGTDLLASFEYDEALVLFESVLNDPTATAGQRLEAWEHIGMLHFNLNRREQAREAFQALLDADLGHQLSQRDYPPRALEFFSEVRNTHRPPASLSLETTAEADEARGQVTVRGTLSATSPFVQEAVLFSRTADQDSYRETTMELQNDQCTATVPLPSQTTVFQYYAEIQAPSGYPLATSGSAEAPLELQVSQTSSEEVEQAQTQLSVRRPWHRSWWFWTIVGVAVAGGVTAAVVTTVPRDSKPAEGSLGTVTLE